jgi:hypothetical protein
MTYFLLRLFIKVKKLLAIKKIFALINIEGA